MEGDDRVSNKEFEAGLSLLHMMQRPSESPGGEGEGPRRGKKRAAGTTSQKSAAKKQRSAMDAGAMLLAVAAKQVGPVGRGDDNDDDEGSQDDGDELWENASPRGLTQRNAQLNTLSHDLSIEGLREHFGKPIVEVAKEFGICTTFLKKICRRCGIKRWPHRQIRSLTRTIEMLRQAEANATSVQEKMKYAAQIAHVEAKKRAVIEDPDANGKLERVKKSVLNRSSSPSNKKSDVPRAAARSVPQPTVQAGLLHAVAAAAAAASAVQETEEVNVPSAAIKSPTTEAEATAAAALLYSSTSPRVVVGSIDVSVPMAPLDDVLPAMTPTATSTPDVRSMSHAQRISPSHRKLLTKGEGECRVRSSSLGSFQDFDDKFTLSQSPETEESSVLASVQDNKPEPMPSEASARAVSHSLPLTGAAS